MSSPNSLKSMYQIWQSVMQYMQEHFEISDTAIDMWIASISFKSFDNGLVRLEVDSDFQKQIVEQQYLERLKEAFYHALGFDVKLLVISTEHKPVIPPVPSNDNFDSNFFFHRNVETGDYTFENFIVGPSNHFAHAAAMAVASNPSSNYNPLFIYGGSGLGKTHLLYAICAHIRENNPHINVVYTKCQDMIDHFYKSLKENTIQDFNQYYKSADVLLVDDIQFVAGKTQLQENFFHTFEYLHSANRQIILTSDRPPREIETLADRLCSRFEMGLRADIQSPDEETRIAIIKKKAYLLQMIIPDDVCEFIAQKKEFANIRQLEGIVKTIHAQYMIGGMKITLHMVDNIIRDFKTKEEEATPITVDRVIEEVSRTFNISISDIRSKGRTAPVTKARQVVFYVLKNTTNLTQKEIGKQVGDFDHTTVIHAFRRVDEIMQVDVSFKNTVNDIIKNLTNL